LKEQDATENDKTTNGKIPFSERFGKLEKIKEPKPKVEKIKRNITSTVELIRCKERIEGKSQYCINKTCVCDFRNKSMRSIFSYKHTQRKTIKQIPHHEFATAPEAYHCKDRIPHKNVFCVKEKCECNYKKCDTSNFVLPPQFNTALEAYQCKGRIKGDTAFCKKKRCECNFKEYDYRDVILKFYKELIQKAIPESLLSDYDKKILNETWHYFMPIPAFLKVKNYVKKMKFVYKLDLTLFDNWELDSYITAFDVLRCKDRIPGKTRYCIREKVKKEKGITCLCRYYKYKAMEILSEATKDIIIEMFDDKITNIWDRITLTLDWGKDFTKKDSESSKLIKNFLKKYINLHEKAFAELKRRLNEK
jgi:hypothetical protein